MNDNFNKIMLAAQDGVFVTGSAKAMQWDTRAQRGECADSMTITLSGITRLICSENPQEVVSRLYLETIERQNHTMLQLLRKFEAGVKEDRDLFNEVVEAETLLEEITGSIKNAEREKL